MLSLHRRTRAAAGAAGLLAVVMFWGVLAGDARAASVTTNCAGLQAALNQAVTGDTITLTQLCTKNNSGAANGQFNLNPTAAQSFTLVGQAGSGAGFDGTGVNARVLFATNAITQPSAMTLRNLIFQNSTSPGASGGAVEFQGKYTVTLDSDTFINNAATSGGGSGAVDINSQATSGSFTITNSVFQNNTAQYSGGAVALFEQSAPLPVTVTNNRFSMNSTTGSGGQDGGALYVTSFNSGTAALTQSGNTFSGNMISGATLDVNGGAESVYGLVLNSTNDLFTGNSIPAPTSGHVAEGAALSMESNSCAATRPQNVASNLVVAGNSVGNGGTPTSVHGAVYLGCGDPNPPNANNLTLNNSTISGNSGGGGTAGVWGGPNDQLTLNNSIVTRNSNGADLTGFTGASGSVTALYSDLCNGVAPFAGTGNICADPLLVSSSTGDVHETAASPTIDAGSNALVPSGLATDVYGNPRIQARNAGGTPIVDIGAAEANTPNATPPGTTQGTTPGTTPPSGGGGTGGGNPTSALPSNAFTIDDGLGQGSNGDITVTLNLPGSGGVELLGTHSVPGAQNAMITPGRGRYDYTELNALVRKAGKLKLTLHANDTGRRLLARHRRFGLPLHIRVWAVYTPTGGKPGRQMRTVKVLGGRARHGHG